MQIDFELYRRDVLVSRQPPVRLSAIDIAPERPLYTILMIHGFGGNATQWQYQLEALSQTNRCIAVDLRGHGRSDKPATSYSMDEIISDLEAVLSSFQVNEKMVVIGHSFGGAIATTFTHRFPERVEKLILTASAARYDLPFYTRALLSLPIPALNLLRPFVKNQISAPPHVLKRMAQNTLYRWNGYGMLRALQPPALVIRAERDLVFPSAAYEEVAKLIPRATDINVGASKHMVILERRDAVERAIDRFLGLGHDSWRSGDRETTQRARLIEERPWLKVYDEGVPFTISIPRRPVQTLLTSAARRYPNRPATIFMRRRLTYRQLERQANRLANALRGMGVDTGTRVMLLMPNCPQWPIAFYAVLKAGGIIVNATPTAPVDELAREVQETGASLLITLARGAATARQIRHQTALQNIIYTHIDDYAAWWLRLLRTLRGRAHLKPLQPGERIWTQLMQGYHANPLDVNVAYTNAATIQYTGGTTARPKGVILSHYALIANAFQTRHWLTNLNESRERVLCVVPFSHAYGMTGGLNTAITMGATMVLLPNFVTAQVLKTIKRHQPTIFPGVPTMYVAINNYPGVRRYNIDAIKACISGAAPLPVEVQEQFEKLTRGRLVEGYGLTEAGPVTHANPIFGQRNTASIGVPLPNTEARVVHLQTGEDLPPGEIGELVIRGPQVMDGYWKLHEATERALHEGWLFTGDVARMDPEGYFQIIARKRDMWYPEQAGERTPQPAFPRDVEEVIYEIPEVKEVAVIGVTGVPIAFVTVKREIAAGTIQGYCQHRLPAELVPRLVIFVDEMPRSFVGKVIRRQLLDHIPEPQLKELDITSDRIDDMLAYPFPDEED